MSQKIVLQNFITQSKRARKFFKKKGQNQNDPQNYFNAVIVKRRKKILPQNCLKIKINLKIFSKLYRFQKGSREMFHNTMQWCGEVRVKSELG